MRQSNSETRPLSNEKKRNVRGDAVQQPRASLITGDIERIWKLTVAKCQSTFEWMLKYGNDAESATERKNKCAAFKVSFQYQHTRTHLRVIYLFHLFLFDFRIPYCMSSSWMFPLGVTPNAAGKSWHGHSIFLNLIFHLFFFKLPQEKGERAFYVTRRTKTNQRRAQHINKRAEPIQDIDLEFPGYIRINWINHCN